MSHCHVFVFFSFSEMIYSCFSFISINYQHCGAPKTWYGIPGHAALDFERVVQDHVYSDHIKGEDGAFSVLAEKTTMFAPNTLLKHDVPVYKAVQMPGEFVIAFPKAYHAGFSQGCICLLLTSLLFQHLHYCNIAYFVYGETSGFTCSEAVNFAVGDWFPFGAEASQRYSRLCRVPIIPYEEILYKEAMLFNESQEQGSSLHSDEDLASYNCLKVSFVHLIRSHRCARQFLKKVKGSLRMSQTSQGTILCGLCKRDCYVSYINCNCNSSPICLFHGTRSMIQLLSFVFHCI